MSLPFGFVVYDLLFKNCFIPQKICTNVFQFGQIFFGNTHQKCVASTGPLPNLKCVLLRLVSIVSMFRRIVLFTTLRLGYLC